MGDKIVTREEREKAVGKVREIFWGSTRFDERAEAYVDAVTEAYSLTVEPPPILPGVTSGEWTPCCGHDADIGKVYIFAKGRSVAEVYSYHDRTLMTGVKKLVELVVADRREHHSRYGTTSDSGRAVFGQLEAMGVDVSEFKGGGE